MMSKHPSHNKGPAETEVRFITDASLAGLAKWLRVLGYDTTVFHQTAGRSMMRCADKENRILLTRRADMVERQFSGSLFLIKDLEVGKQLKAVIERFALKIDRDKMFGICLICNEKLLPVSREKVRDLVPPYVFENCSRYNECPRCKKIYWMGTHSRNAFRFMEQHIPNHLP